MDPKFEVERKRVHKGTAGMSVEEKMARNRASNRRSNLSRVRVGDHLERWNSIKKRYGLRTDVDMAKMVLDNFEAVQARNPKKSSTSSLHGTKRIDNQGSKVVTPRKLQTTPLSTSNTLKTTTQQAALLSTANSLQSARHADSDVFSAVRTWKQHIVTFGTSPSSLGTRTVENQGFQAVQAAPQQISYLGIATPSHISQTLDIASSGTLQSSTQRLSPFSSLSSLPGAVVVNEDGDSGSEVPGVTALTNPTPPRSPKLLASSSGKGRGKGQINDLPSYKAQNLMSVIARLPALQKAKTKDERL
ncbi:hypothetical protein BSL78_16337 [Apostichopus japonicus]|uniref:Uncharacterized protein n=1 Tax=Stichopus japonicus TaxID=307972 RepID=A0A2G8KFM5_STIJA|nr:hypothetical protein BSL78_16337 [Apostichopus japonicus]